MATMNTLTIPKKITRGEELIIIPRKEYEKFLLISKKRPTSKLDRDLNRAITEVRRGEIFGPFETADKLLQSLKSKK